MVKEVAGDRVELVREEAEEEEEEWVEAEWVREDFVFVLIAGIGFRINPGCPA